MAQLTEPVFSINGNPLTVFKSFSLTQNIFEHHHFTLVCPAEAIDGKEGLFSNTRDMIGGSFGARISGVGLQGHVLFSGIVTGVETSRFTGHHGDVMITGYSPTIILDSGPHCKSWEKKAIKNIANDVLRFFPQNLLEPKVQPLYGETLAYTVQYKETAWEFLKRLTATYGEWIFWDGRNLVVGPPRSDQKTQLIYGAHLSRFNMALQARPTDNKYIAWDHLNSQVYESQAQDVPQKAGLNFWGEHMYKAGKLVYGTQPKVFNMRYTSSKKQQDDLASLRSAMESSRMVQFTGESGHPGIALGSIIDVSGSNVFNMQTEGYGEYLVTGMHHAVDAMGNYSNSFTAVPSSIKVPPVPAPAEPNCETQSAIVTDNHDYHGLGRVRVKFHWMNGAEKTPWLRVASPHGGGGKGHFFIPEVGEEVIVGFEGDNPHKPYVIGTVYHGQASNSFSNADNDIKATQTRSGVQTVYNDKEGSLYMSDKGGVNTKYDGAGGLTANASKTHISNTGEKHVINVGENQCLLEMDNGGNITLKGNANISIETGASSIKMDSAGNITIQGQHVKVVGSGTTEVGKEGGNPGMKVAGDVTIEGKPVNIN